MKTYVPHSYQQHATDRILAQPSLGLFLEMGMGKTVATLTAIDELLYNEFQSFKVLVIAPLRVAEMTWDGEARKWAHLKHLTFSKVLGDAKTRKAALKAKADVYLINRENVPWLVETVGDDWPFGMVVVDELSSFKSQSSKRWKALRKVRGKIERLVGLTGTPAPNGLLDLWSQVWLLDGGARLGRTYSAYRDAYFVPDQRNRTQIFSYKPAEGSEAAIYRKIDDITVSMKAEDWLTLPQRIDNQIMVTLDAAERGVYEQLEHDSLLPFAAGDIEAATAAVLSNKLLQLAGGAAYDENGSYQIIHSRKFEALDDIIEAQQGKPVLIYYGFRHELERLQQRYPNAVKLTDAKSINDWNLGHIEILLAHPASAGHGLNLQAGGNAIVWFSLPWSLELYEQANARLHRQGQTQAVIIHHLLTEQTIDEDVLAALTDKAATQGALMDALKARINKLEKETV